MAVQVPILDTTKLHARLDEIIASRPTDKPYAELLVLSDDIQAFVIVHPPGTPNDTHYHEHDEWWVVMRGEINWYLNNAEEPTVRARAGDFVLCPKFTNHHLEPVGSELTVRIGINTRGEFHRYDRDGCRSDLWRTENS